MGVGPPGVMSPEPPRSCTRSQTQAAGPHLGARRPSVQDEGPQAFLPIFAVLDHFIAPLDFAVLIPRILDAAVEVHHQNAAIHEALHALASADKVVGDKFMALEEEVTRRMADALRDAGYRDPALYEKVHWAMDSVQSFAHECIYDQHAYIDYTVLRHIVETALLNLFRQEALK